MQGRDQSVLESALRLVQSCIEYSIYRTGDMYPLKASLSQHGFTSTESYDHAIRCYLANPTEGIRCLNVDGDSGRRRTAFAHALANVMGATHVLYYEFGRDKPVPQIIRIQEGEEVVEEPPVEAFDRALTEACAQSEAEHTVLIIDQLHKTQFMNHIRLYEFLQNGLWKYSDVQFQANLQNLKVFLISDEPLYHSLQKTSFRVWISDEFDPSRQINPAELGLNQENSPWLGPLQRLLNQLKLSPTVEEFRRLAFDIEQQVRTEHQLKVSMFGWLESLDRKQLDDESLKPYLDDVLLGIQQGLDIHEEIEISGL